MKDACTETTEANESPFVRNVRNMQKEGRLEKFEIKRLYLGGETNQPNYYFSGWIYILNESTVIFLF